MAADKRVLGRRKNVLTLFGVKEDSVPNRIIRAGINRSDRVNSLSWGAEVFYRRLLNEVDDYGLYDGRPKILRAQLYAACLDRVREADIDRWKAECQTATLVRLYEADGKPYIEVFDVRWPARSEPKFPKPLPLEKSARNCAQLSPYSSAYSSTKTRTKRPKAARYVFFPADLPPALATPAFVTAWQSWVEHRIEIGFPLTEKAVELQMRKVALWGPEKAVEAIERSISSRWRDVYEPKGDFTPKPVADVFSRRDVDDAELDELLGKSGGEK